MILTSCHVQVQGASSIIEMTYRNSQKIALVNRFCENILPGCNREQRKPVESDFSGATFLTLTTLAGLSKGEGDGIIGHILTRAIGNWIGKLGIV